MQSRHQSDTRAVGGDAAAFRTLVEQHKCMVFSIACRMLGDVRIAEEVAQDVFLELSRSMARLEAEAHTYPLAPANGDTPSHRCHPAAQDPARSDGGSMGGELGLAARNGGDHGALAQKLDDMVVRAYEFAHENDYDMDDLKPIFEELDEGGWKHLVRSRESQGDDRLLRQAGLRGCD